MCGIAGCFDLDARSSAERLAALARDMADRLVHRGPDEGAVWVNADAGIALGHRRLSIIDLSAAGSQPMHSADGRYTLAFNGEIYNHQDFRKELASAGMTFRGHSDTEALVEAIARWSLGRALDKSNGMFAFAVWDARQRTLSLARDRLGIKPLYYAWLGRHFVFASELKAFHSHPDFRPELDRNSIALLLQHSYIPAPATIYRNVRKLAPGCLLTISQASSESTAPQSFWSLREAIHQGRENPFRGSENDAADELESLLNDSIALQRLADVPVGAFLSGGIDSSLVVALMQAQKAGSVRTFTIGFHDPEFNEAPFAAQIAQHLKLEHTEQIISPDEAQDVIPRLPEIFDEPFADVSQIPTFLVSQLARRHVTVSLSGDGGDELFGGYARYAHIDRIWRQIAWLPAPLRRTAAGVYQQVIHRTLRRRLGHSLQSRVLASGDRRALYEQLHRHWDAPASIVIGAGDESSDSLWQSHWIRGETFVEEMMALDMTTYLPDCILTKLDRASMAVSLEARVPLLDHRIVEFAWRLPLRFKYEGGIGKRLLRQILGRHLPRALFERPKRGFGVPIGDWLRGRLRPWAEALLAEDRLRAEGIFHPQPIRQKWLEHTSGRYNWQYPLWDVLMFQAWLEHLVG